ncbi:MAG: HD domain-containing phosphohydrolase [Candidatus Omnitrophota bacterium]
MLKDKVNGLALNTLLEISRTIISALDIERVNEVILREAERMFHNDYGALFILDEKSARLGLAAARGFSEDESENLKILGAWEEINKLVMDFSAPLIVNDTGANPELNKKNFPFRSFLSIRLEAEKNTIGVLTLSNKNPSELLYSGQQHILQILANYASIALVNAKLYKETEDLFIGLISSLVAAIDAKDPYTAGHSQRVTKIALSVAEELNLPRNQVKNLKLAAILHDIGKIGISELILTKPEELTSEEHKIIEQHPEIGIKIVSSIPHLKRFVRGIGEHHEFYGGGGYPRGLKGDDISLEARIIAVADVTDALTSDRAYRRGMSLPEACEEIKKKSGTQFDPQVVEALLRVYENKPEIFSQ